MKKALLICGKNIPACMSMAMNLNKAGYEPCDAAAFSPDAFMLRGAAGIGEVRILRRRDVCREALEKGAAASGKTAEESFGIFTRRKYDLSVNTGLSGAAAALQGSVDAGAKSGMIKKEGKIGYSGLWYFYEMASVGKVYASGVYNDISYYNSLLLGYVDGLYDYEPAGGSAAEQKNTALILSRTKMPGSLGGKIAEEAAALLEKTGISTSTACAAPSECAIFAAKANPGYLITDSSSAACSAAASGAAVVYVCTQQRQCASGPFSKRSITIKGKAAPYLIAEAVSGIRKGKGTLPAESKGGVCSLSYAPAVNPFFLMEKEINSYFGFYKNDISAGKVFEDALEKSGDTALKILFYKNMFGVNVLPDELSHGMETKA
jgi:hypothetical protein